MASQVSFPSPSVEPKYPPKELPLTITYNGNTYTNGEYVLYTGFHNGPARNGMLRNLGNKWVISPPHEPHIQYTLITNINHLLDGSVTIKKQPDQDFTWHYDVNARGGKRSRRFKRNKKTRRK